MDKVESNDNHRSRLFPLSMDKVESDEEALVVESYMAFIKIKENPNNGSVLILYGFVLIILMPIVLLQIFPLDMWFHSEGTELCCGSLFLGFVMFIWGLAQKGSHRESYNIAAQDLAQAVCHYFYSNENSVETVEDINLLGFAMLGEGNAGRINNKDWIYLARYFYSKEKWSQRIPRKVVLSQHEEE